MKQVVYVRNKDAFSYADFYAEFKSLIAKACVKYENIEVINLELESGMLQIEVETEGKLRDIARITPKGNDEKIIYLSDLFLAYLWCQSYINIVQYDFFKAKRLTDLGISFNSTMVPSFDGFIGSCMLSEFSDNIVGDQLRKWGCYPQTCALLPNPFIVETNNEVYIKKANSVFTNALAFILQHEYKHDFFLELSDAKSLTEGHQQEFDADESALRTLNSLAPENAFSYSAGIATAYVSIHKVETMLDIEYTAFDTHPSTIARLTKAGQQIIKSNDDMLAEFSGFILDQINPIVKPIAADGFNYDSAKEYYDDILKSLTPIGY